MPSDSVPPQAHRVETHEDGLRHQLSAGQMAMVAVGGSIGTGLLLGSGAAMEVAERQRAYTGQPALQVDPRREPGLQKREAYAEEACD